MLEGVVGDLFGGSSPIVITTNGVVVRGRAVMGRGCALEASTRWPQFPVLLGQHLAQHGNVTGVFDLGDRLVFTLPVKPAQVIVGPGANNIIRSMRSRVHPGDVVPGWMSVAQLPLIERSARQLVVLVDRLHITKVTLPRPGCGAGELTWQQVRVVLKDILDDRFIVVTKEGG